MNSLERKSAEARTQAADGRAPGRDSWDALSRYTSARIALGRSGGSLRTGSLLDFRLAHARARDAVHEAFSAEEFVARLKQRGVDGVVERSGATSRNEYLMRPDLGRRLSESSRKRLCEAASLWGRRDLIAIVSDGLAAQAASKHALDTVARLFSGLERAGWSLYPVLIVPFARVKLQDEIGELLGAGHSLMLLGERPGLGSPDSLGAYFTYGPRAERTDADRNCVSNIRAEGLPPGEAASKLLALLCESRRRKTSGVALKELSATAPALTVS